MAEQQSQLLRTALAVIDGYNKWTLDAILAPRAQECTQRVYPDRLGRPTLSNDQYREYFGRMIPNFKNFAVEILDTVEDAKNHKVVFHARSTAETSLGPYGNEYMILIRTTDDDREVLNVKEFVDSGYSESFFPKLQAYLAQQASES